LLSKLRKIAIAGDPNDFHAFSSNGGSKGAYAQPGRVIGSKVFIDYDDGETEFLGNLA
jgi:hypothetical protein